jgi:dienelactone hydrolase
MHRLSLIWLLAFSTCAAAPLSQEAGKPEDLGPPPPWFELKSAYDYNSKVIVVVADRPREDPDYFLRHISFTNGYGQKVTGLFIRPKAEGVYPCILLLHGLGGDKEGMIDGLGRMIAEKGMAALALDAWLQGERTDQNTFANSKKVATGMVTRITAVDYRMALDYLKSRKDIEGERIGLLGYSLGAATGAIVSGVDDRIKATALCMCGDPIRPRIKGQTPEQKLAIEQVSQSNFVGHISPRPLLLLNGKNDDTMNVHLPLILAAARAPKDIVTVDSGHEIPESARKQAVDWLKSKLTRGEVKPKPESSK